MDSEGEALGSCVGPLLLEGAVEGFSEGLLLNEGFDVGSALGSFESEGEALG